MVASYMTSKGNFARKWVKSEAKINIWQFTYCGQISGALFSRPALSFHAMTIFSTLYTGTGCDGHTDFRESLLKRSHALRAALLALRMWTLHKQGIRRAGCTDTARRDLNYP
jgi:hypothetical protein